MRVVSLSVGPEDELRADGLILDGRLEQVYVDLYLDDEVRAKLSELYELVARRFVQGAEKCSACIGACCTHLIHNEILVTEVDRDRLRTAVSEETLEAALIPSHSLSAPYQFLFIDHGRKIGLGCPFFQGETGRCTVYNQRPAVCREFSAAACEVQVLKKPDVSRVRWNKLLPSDTVEVGADNRPFIRRRDGR